MMHVQVSMLEQMMREIKQAGRAGVLMADLHRSLGIDTRVAYDLALQLVQVTRVPVPGLCWLRDRVAVTAGCRLNDIM